MKALLSLFAVFVPVLFYGQIQLYSIKAIRQSPPSRYTLDGSLMAYSKAKLLNSTNFGPTGTYKKLVNINESYEFSDSLINIASAPTDGIFFFGNFDIYSTSEAFTSDEINALYQWSLAGGKVIILSGVIDNNGTANSQVLNATWGFGCEEFTGQNTPKAAGDSIFHGRFGPAANMNTVGLLNDYFDSIPSNSKVFASTGAGTSKESPSLYMDCNTLDLVVSDYRVFTSQGGISSSDAIQNTADVFLANTIAFMDRLQQPPQLLHSGDIMHVDSTYVHYQWYKDGDPIAGADSSSFIAEGFGTYYVNTTVNGGCIVKSNDFIKPDTTLILDNECDLFVPTAFSPDGNGNNDRLCMYGRCFEDIEFKIFDRWGELVFESDKRWLCWDGIYKGKEANSGVYAWSVKATRPSGTKINRKGSFTLIRK